MVRHLFICVGLVFLSTLVLGQSKYLCQESEVTFFSSAPLEDITAVNSAMNGVIDFEGKQFLVRIPIIRFDFPNDLMEEHFNENYMDTEDFPNAIYKGTFNETIDPKKQGESSIQCSGTLEIHGVEQQREISVNLTIGKNSIQATSEFVVSLADHEIDIPKIVFQKIAEEIEVSIDATFEPLK